MRITFSPKKLLVVHQCNFLAQAVIDEYISISKTRRLFILSYVKNGHVFAQKLIDKKEFTIDELKESIKNLHNDCKYKKFGNILKWNTS